MHVSGTPQTSVIMTMCLAVLSQLLQHAIDKFQRFFSLFGPEIFSNESQKSSSCESQSQPNEKFPTTNKYENGKYNKKKAKYLEKKRNKYNYLDDKANCVNAELSDTTNNNVEETKNKIKKKSKLKRRKRFRVLSSCESDLSESDLSLNDMSTDDESYSEGSDSDDVLSSESEDLDETLLIIDQKLKDKKNKEENKTNCLENSGSIANFSKELCMLKCNDESDEFGKSYGKNGVPEKNGIKVLNDKDKARSLFTILNDTEDDVKMNDSSKGDFTFEGSVNDSDTANGNTLSESATNESSELGK